MLLIGMAVGMAGSTIYAPTTLHSRSIHAAQMHGFAQGLDAGDGHDARSAPHC